jgi:hypothetical protein
MKTGEVVEPVKVHDDGRGLRFYASVNRQIVLLGSSYGAKIASWGEKRRLVQGGPRVELPAKIEGSLPETIESFEALKGCQCSAPVKAFRPPTAWEEVPA